MLKRAYLSTILALLVSAPAICQPKITVVGHDTINVGKIFNTGDHITRTFRVMNTGDRTLHIKGVRTTCGCTIALVSDSLIAPGHKSEINVDFNPAGYSGNVTKYVYVMSDDSTAPMTTLQLQMEIAYALRANPDFISFENAKTGKPDTASVILTNISDDELDIVAVETSSRTLTSNFREIRLKSGKALDFNYTLREKEPGRMSGRFLLSRQAGCSQNSN